MGDPGKHKSAPHCSSASTATDGSVPCPQQHNSTTAAANSNHELPPAALRAASSDHVLIKWHDSWLDHVLISQLPWLHELSSISNGLDIWLVLLAPLWVLQRQDRWKNVIIIEDTHQLFERVLHKTLLLLGTAACCIMFYITQAFCVHSKCAGIRNELNWIQLEWKGHKDQDPCEGSLGSVLANEKADSWLRWPIRGHDSALGQRSGWLAEIDLERKRLSDVCNHKMQIRAIYWVILEHNIWIISHNALQ